MQSKALKKPQASDAIHRCMWVRRVPKASAAGEGGSFISGLEGAQRGWRVTSAIYQEMDLLGDRK